MKRQKQKQTVLLQGDKTYYQDVQYIIVNLQCCSTVMSTNISVVHQALWTKRVSENYATLASLPSLTEIINCFHQLLYYILETTEPRIGRWVQCEKKCLSQIRKQGLCKMKLNTRLVPQKLTEDQKDSHFEICAFWKLRSFNPDADQTSCLQYDFNANGIVQSRYAQALILSLSEKLILSLQKQRYCWLFLGAFAKLQKANITLLCLSVHVKQLSSNWTDFHEIWHIFCKYVEQIQFSLKSNRNNGYFTWRPTYIYGNILLNSSKNETYFWQKFHRRWKHTFYIQERFLPKSCQITNATDSHPEYVILILFPWQQWHRKCTSKLSLYVHCLPCLL